MNLGQLRSVLLLAVTGLALLTNNCTSPDNSNASAGDSNGSGVGNGMIMGKLYKPDGKTPANGATVTVWDRKAQPKIDSSGNVSPATPVLQTKTDEKGVYSIDRIAPGTYSIEASDNKDMARIDSIIVATVETHIDSLTDTLKAPGAFRVNIVYNRDTNEVLSVSCIGTHIVIFHQDSKSSFSITHVPEGYYYLQAEYLRPLQITLKLGCVQKTAWVSSGDTTIETIVIPENLPVIERIGITYDPIKHSATISWQNRRGWFPAAGYNLYRKVSGDSLFGSPLNGSEIIHDTMFVDSNVSSGSKYQYAVAAVDSAKMEGPLSEIVTVSTLNGIIDLDTSTTSLPVVTTSTLTGEIKQDTLSKLIELDNQCFNLHNYSIFNSKNPKYINVMDDHPQCGKEPCPVKNQSYSAVDGSLVSSFEVPSGGCIEFENDRVVYYTMIDAVNSQIIYRDKAGNEKILESFKYDFAGCDFDGNSIAIVRSMKLNMQDSTSSECSIEMSKTDDGIIVYSIKVSSLSGFRDVRICADGIRLFFLDRILQFDTSGKQTASFEIPSKYWGDDVCYYADSLYMIKHLDVDRLITELAVYNFSGEQLFKYELKGGLRPYLANNGDIYLLDCSRRKEKWAIYRLPNPLLKD